MSPRGHSGSMSMGWATNGVACAFGSPANVGLELLEHDFSDSGVDA